MLLIPTIIMIIVTFTSLILSIRVRVEQLMAGSPNAAILEMQIGVAVLLLCLGALVTISCTAKLLEKEPIAGEE